MDSKSLSEYELTSVSSCASDVSCGGQYLGRLYILPANDPQLTSAGIDKKWFLTHLVGDFVVSGHINELGQWSLSSHQSLEPSLEYVSQSEIFAQIFRSDYVREVNAIKQESELDERITLSFQKNPDSTDNNEGSDDKFKPILEPGFSEARQGLNIPNLEALRELVKREQFRKEEQSEELADELTLAKERDVEERDEEAVLLERVGDKEIRRSTIEESLVRAILENHRKYELVEFFFGTQGMVKVHPERDYFVLSDADDGRIMLSASLDGRVLEPLSQSDAEIWAINLKSEEELGKESGQELEMIEDRQKDEELVEGVSATSEDSLSEKGDRSSPPSPLTGSTESEKKKQSKGDKGIEHDK